MRFLKGQSLQLNEMVEIFIVLLIGSVVFLFIINGSGGLAKLVDEFCGKYPEWCGGKKTPQDDALMARASAQALAQAINCVSDPDACPCKEGPCMYSPESSDSFSGMAAGKVSYQGESPLDNPLGGWEDQTPNIDSSQEPKKESNIVEVQCEKEIVNSVDPENIQLTDTYDPRAGKYMNPDPSKYFDCKDYIIGGFNHGLMCKYCPEGTYNTRTKKCDIESKEQMSCSVTNFNLPQKFEGVVDSAEEWIDGFGDPLFLVYWQKFPVGEDVWSKESAWFSGAGKLLFGALCMGRVIGGVYTTFFKPGKVVKATGNMVKESASWIRNKISKIREILGSERISSESDDIINLIESGNWVKKNDIWVLKENTPKDKAISVIKSTLSKTLSKDTLKKSFTTFRKISPRTAMYSGASAAIADESAYLDARIGSELGKFIEEPNKLVLQKALAYKANVEESISIKPVFAKPDISDPTKENIVDMGRPVLLNKEISFYPDKITGLYFASPCRADLNVKTQSVACESYIYDKKTGMTECESPDTSSWYDNPDRKCGTFFTDIKENPSEGIDFLSKAAALIRNMKSKQVFKKDSMGYTIYDPINNVTLHLTENPEIVCCKNKKEGEKFWSVKNACSLPTYMTLDDSECNEEKPSYMLVFDSINSQYLKPSASNCMENFRPEHGIDKEIFGSEENLNLCNFRDIRIYRKYYPYFNSLGQYITTTASYIFSKDENGNIKNFDGIVVWYYREGLWDADNGVYTIFFLNDINEDGYIDEIGQFYWIGGDKVQQYRIFQDSDYDGTADKILANRCFTDGIVVFPDKSGYDDDPNFCYTRKNAAVGIGTTVGMFAIDAFLKRIPSPYTWIAGTVADCGLFILDIKYGNFNWPH